MTKKWGTKVENIDVCSPDVLKYIKLPVCITILDPRAIEDVREMLKNQYEYDLVNEVDYLTYQKRVDLLLNMIAEMEQYQNQEWVSKRYLWG